MDRTSFIMEELSRLVRLADAEISISDGLDEILISYILGVIAEPLSSVDVAEFASIMDAYIPGFLSIDVGLIRNWIAEVKQISEMSSLHSVEQIGCEPVPSSDRHPVPVDGNSIGTSSTPARFEVQRQPSALDSIAQLIECGESANSASAASCIPDKETFYKNNSFSTSTENGTRVTDNGCFQEERSKTEISKGHKNRTKLDRSLSSPASPKNYAEPESRRDTQKNSSSVIDSSPDSQNAIQVLVDMFPNISLDHLERKLRLCKCDLEGTILKILEEDGMASGVITTSKSGHKKDGAKETVSKGKTKVRNKNKNVTEAATTDEGSLASAEEIKSLIINKYSFIPTDLENKSYTPKLATDDGKKLIRYRDNQVVSTKGEKFTEIKEPMTEEMKKTYINLKPAKQYKKH